MRFGALKSETTKSGSPDWSGNKSVLLPRYDKWRHVERQIRHVILDLEVFGVKYIRRAEEITVPCAELVERFCLVSSGTLDLYGGNVVPSGQVRLRHKEVYLHPVGAGTCARRSVKVELLPRRSKHLRNKIFVYYTSVDLKPSSQKPLLNFAN